MGSLAGIKFGVARAPSNAGSESFLRRLTDWIDAHPTRAFLTLSACYLGVVCTMSSTKLLWLDELITLHIARLNSVSAIWRALAQGADPNPPLTHILVMLCRRLFGEHELALRLPAIAGYWLGMLSLFLFARRRLPGVWAIASVLATLAMGAFEWSYESRSYALFYGTTMLAVLAWSRIPHTGVFSLRRSLALGSMTLALAASISANYFAVLAFLPVAAAELVRALQLATQTSARPLRLRAIVRAADWPVWACLVLAGTPMLAFRPLIARSIALYTPYAWNKISLDRIFDGYSDIVETTLFPLLGLVAFSCLIFWLGAFAADRSDVIRPRWIGRLVGAQARFHGRLGPFPLPETTAILVLMAYPLLGCALAYLRGGMFSPRFVLPVCLGFGVAGAAAGYRTFGHCRSAGAIAILLCTAWWVVRETYIGYWYEEQKQSFYKVIAHMPAPEYAGEPIVIADNLLVLPFAYYAPPEMRARMVFPVDFPAILRYRGEASGEVNLWNGRHSIYSFPIVPLADLQRSAERYIIVDGSRDWLTKDLNVHRYPAHYLNINARADTISFWATPLGHGTPVFFEGGGDRYMSQWFHLGDKPNPFVASRNVPSGQQSPK